MIGHASARALFLAAMLGAAASGAAADPSLLAYYPFDGDAEDVSGNGRDGTIHGAVPTEDRFGNPSAAYFFDGIDDYIVASSNGLPTGERTVALWFKLSELSIPRMVPVAYGGNGCGTSWFQQIGSDGIGVSSHCNVNNVLSEFVPEAGVWYHWVVTTSASGTRFYVNGQEILSSLLFVDNTDVVPGRHLAIGTCVDTQGMAPYADGSVTFTHGAIDEVRIYDRELSPSEVQVLAGHVDLAVRKSGPTGPVPMNETIEWTLVVTNDGPAEAPGVTLLDELPEGLAFISATPSLGSCSEADGLITCELGTIAPGDSVVVQVLGTLAQVMISNTASVTADGQDVNPLDNSTSALVEVDCPITGVEGSPYVSTTANPRPSAPNPFRSLTTIGIELAVAARAEILVYDVTGRLVRRLLGARLDAGAYAVPWDGTDARGRRLPAGTYLYQLRLDGTVVGAQRAVLLR